jgi:hypothetical protein
VRRNEVAIATPTPVDHFQQSVNMFVAQWKGGGGSRAVQPVLEAGMPLTTGRDESLSQSLAVNVDPADN